MTKTNPLHAMLICSIAILTIATLGCGSGSDAISDVTNEMESEIKAHDAAVEDAEKAQSATTKKK